MGTLLSKFRINTAEDFKNSFNVDDNKTYSFIGRTKQFTDDINIQDFIDNQFSYKELWKEMISFKKIQSTDISLGIRRVNWAINTIYQQYDDIDSKLFEKDFYVMNSTFDVYKCIDNNDNSPSTVEPTGQSTSMITLSDSYKWKYMYTLDAVESTRFLNVDLIPIKKLEANDGSQQWNVQNNTIPGTLDRVDITKNETTFTVAPTITIIGDGTGATATAQMNGNILEKVVISNPGSDYTEIEVKIIGSEDDVELRGVLSPVEGHGYSAVDELFGFNTIINFTYEGNVEGEFITDNDYRSVGVLRNPYSYGTTDVIDVTAGSQTWKLNCQNISTFVKDELITGNISGATGIVVSVDDDIVKINDINGDFIDGETIVGDTSLVTNTIVSQENWDLERFSGDVLYAAYRAPVERSVDITESYKLNVFF